TSAAIAFTADSTGGALGIADAAAGTGVTVGVTIGLAWIVADCHTPASRQTIAIENAAPADCQSGVITSRPRIRRMRVPKLPPVAGTANTGSVDRTRSSSMSACAYARRSPQTLIARSSQQCSRSVRILADSHQTAG